MPKKHVARKGKVRTPPSTPDNCEGEGAKMYRKFSPATAKIQESVIALIQQQTMQLRL